MLLLIKILRKFKKNNLNNLLGHTFHSIGNLLNYRTKNNSTNHGQEKFLGRFTLCTWLLGFQKKKNKLNKIGLDSEELAVKGYTQLKIIYTFWYKI